MEDMQINKSSNVNSSFLIPHSSFLIPHSSFLIQRSAYASLS